MPEYARLSDKVSRGRLLAIRSAVAPILQSNVVSTLTDHTVDHSDRLCDLIDKLSISLRQPLDSQEAFVLYAAAYLHDVGMQHERCDDTQVIGRALLNPPYCGRRQWSELPQPTQWQLIREHHHAISSEMVLQSIDTVTPVLGISLTRDDRPHTIAALCEAHCVPPDEQRYSELTADGLLRTALLAALLRLADILDESQRRSVLYRERTVALDICARVHWWRHSYVAEVRLLPEEHRIEIWFEYPAACRRDYHKLLPELQLPLIEAELRAHRAVLAANGVTWHLEAKEVSAQHSDASPMPDEVHLRMLEELHLRRQAIATTERMITYRQLELAQTVVADQVRAVRESSDDPITKLHKTEDLAKQLRGVGGNHDACMLFFEAYADAQKSLGREQSVEFGLRLVAMLMESDMTSAAMDAMLRIKPAALSLPSGDSRRTGFMMLWCRVLLANAAVEQAREVLEELRTVESPQAALADLGIECAEAEALLGETAEDCAEGQPSPRDEGIR